MKYIWTVYHAAAAAAAAVESKDVLLSQWDTE